MTDETPKDVNVAIVHVKGCSEILLKTYLSIAELDRRFSAPLDDSIDEMTWVTIPCLNADYALGIRRVSRTDIGSYFVCPDLIDNRAERANIVRAGPSRGPGVIPSGRR